MVQMKAFAEGAPQSQASGAAASEHFNRVTGFDNSQYADQPVLDAIMRRDLLTCSSLRTLAE
jgi:hypothetical protein